jgi:hypothetical protein
MPVGIGAANAATPDAAQSSAANAKKAMSFIVRFIRFLLQAAFAGIAYATQDCGPSGVLTVRHSNKVR